MPELSALEWYYADIFEELHTPPPPTGYISLMELEAYLRIFGQPLESLSVFVKTIRRVEYELVVYYEAKRKSEEE